MLDNEPIGIRTTTWWVLVEECDGCRNCFTYVPYNLATCPFCGNRCTKHPYFEHDDHNYINYANGVSNGVPRLEELCYVKTVIVFRGELERWL